jgi:hypothetical protein
MYYRMILVIVATLLVPQELALVLLVVLVLVVLVVRLVLVVVLLLLLVVLPQGLVPQILVYLLQVLAFLVLAILILEMPLELEKLVAFVQLDLQLELQLLAPVQLVELHYILPNNEYLLFWSTPFSTSQTMPAYLLTQYTDFHCEREKIFLHTGQRLVLRVRVSLQGSVLTLQ